MAERYQREIEEILEKVESDAVLPRVRPTRQAGPATRFFRSLGQRLGRPRLGVSPGRLMLVSLALLLSALVVNMVQPGLVAFFLWGALVVFLVAYALFFIRPSDRYEKRWRGRPVESARPSLWSRVRRFLRG